MATRSRRIAFLHIQPMLPHLFVHRRAVEIALGGLAVRVGGEMKDAGFGDGRRGGGGAGVGAAEVRAAEPRAFFVRKAIPDYSSAPKSRKNSCSRWRRSPLGRGSGSSGTITNAPRFSWSKM